ncbi:MAG: Fic family protein [Thermoplasmata archaeon]|nr:Fic family protein [Thermoplasmata archaeon]
MHRYGYGELEAGIPPDIVCLAMEISNLQGQEARRRIGNRESYDALYAEARVSSVMYSNLIEGIWVKRSRVEAICDRADEPENEEEREVAGYRDALDEVRSGRTFMEPGTDAIERLHGMLMSYASMDGGHYKEKDNAIISSDGRGNTTLIFAPVSADETPEAMERMLEAYELYSGNPRIPQLILIPCVIHDFLCIHPFTDGNGRMSRLLTESLLVANGYDVCLYRSMDEMICTSRNGYYSSLARSSSGWHLNTHSYYPFVRYFLERLRKCYYDLGAIVPFKVRETS